jgi:hypothetical protein
MLIGLKHMKSQIRLRRNKKLQGFLPLAPPEHTVELTMPTKKLLWLDKEECLFPGSGNSGQKH